MATSERTASTMWIDEMQDRLDKLKFLANYNFEYVLRPGTKRSTHIANIIAGLYSFNEAGFTWGDKYMPIWLSSDRMVKGSLDSTIETLVNNLYEGSKTKADNGEEFEIDYFGNWFIEGKFEDEVDAQREIMSVATEQIRQQVEGADPTNRHFIFRNILLENYNNLN